MVLMQSIGHIIKHGVESGVTFGVNFGVVFQKWKRGVGAWVVFFAPQNFQAHIFMNILMMNHWKQISGLLTQHPPHKKKPD